MKFTKPIHIIAAQRTPIGRLGGALQSIGAVDLALTAGRAVLDQAAVSPAAIDSAVFGQVLQAGAGMNLARQVALQLDAPVTTPAYTINMVCGSGLKAVATGATEIHNGEAHVVLAGGAESMSQAPFLVKSMRCGTSTYNAGTGVWICNTSAR
jgi:acetyl-CoA C-acetyltransferase